VPRTTGLSVRLKFAEVEGAGWQAIRRPVQRVYPAFALPVHDGAWFGLASLFTPVSGHFSILDGLQAATGLQVGTKAFMVISSQIFRSFRTHKNDPAATVCIRSL
jgi:hypothetical protein